LTGFNLGWRGWLGQGFAMGVGEVKLKGMVRPDRKRVTYHIDFTRVIDRKLKLGVADGRVMADGELVCEATGMKVGLAAAAS
jgi:3-hydroxyacyl-[acyl-carrier protein] dehydratase/trans-2-decenoyl-[acyl-carrier protein] isomerase